MNYTPYRPLPYDLERARGRRVRRRRVVLAALAVVTLGLLLLTFLR